MNDGNPTWWIFQGSGEPHDLVLPPAPAWRKFTRQEQGSDPSDTFDNVSNALWTEDELHRARTFKSTRRMRELVNAALLLRRPLLITGDPGTGKSSLAYAVAYELQLGQVLTWPITSRSTLQDAIYRYDALGRLQDTNLENIKQASRHSKRLAYAKQADRERRSNIGKYIRLGPLGTALLPTRNPQVLLIDEIDKASVDLPNDLLHIFETGKYEIPELSRLLEDWIDVKPQYGDESVRIFRGKVTCNEFPFVILTSNGERDLPPAFLRRCVRLDIKAPSPKQLAEIVEKKFPEDERKLLNEVVELFEDKRTQGGMLATDQLLNAIYLRLQNVDLLAELDEEPFDPNDNTDKMRLIDAIMRRLNE